MKKRLLCVFAGALVTTLAACASAQATVTPTTGSAPTLDAAETPTERVAAAESGEDPDRAAEPTPEGDSPSPTVAEGSALDSASVGDPMPGCTVVSQPFGNGGESESVFEPVGEDDWAAGPADAPVTIVEYGDFQ